MRFQCYVAAIGACCALGACAAPQGDQAAPFEFIRGATINQVQNAILSQEVQKGWTIAQQSANVLALEKPFNSFGFTLITGAQGSTMRATYIFVQDARGVDVTGAITLIANQGFGNTSTYPDGRDAPAMQAMLDRVAADFHH